MRKHPARCLRGNSKLAVAAPESAPNNTATGCPGDTEKGLAGFVLTPLGRLESVVSTASEKPCSEVTVTETAELVSPCATLKVLVDSASKKSAGKGEAGPHFRLHLHHIHCNRQ
jgi:hypothetical protein